MIEHLRDYSRETFFEFLSGNRSAAECAAEVRVIGLEISEEELKNARREGRAATAKYGSEPVHLSQPTCIAYSYREDAV